MLTVSRGVASPRTREFRAGEPHDAATIGSAGDWQLRGPGVEPIHAYVLFDGESLYVQSALEGQDILCSGRPVGNDWVAVAVSDVIEIGSARITLTQVGAPGPDGLDGAVTGEERTAFLPLASLEARRAPVPVLTQPHDDDEDEVTRYPGVPPRGFQTDDDEATRFPNVPVPASPRSVVRSPGSSNRAPVSFAVDDDEATRMVSLEVKAPPVPPVPPAPDSEPETETNGDPYDDLQERTIAAMGLSAAVPAVDRGSVAVPRRPDTLAPHTPTGPVAGLAPVQAYGHDAAVPAPRASQPHAGFVPPEAPRAAGSAPRLSEPPPPRAAESAPALEPSKIVAAPRPKPDVSIPGPSIGEMTRVAPLTSEGEAARQFVTSQPTTVSKRRAAEAAAANAAANDGMTRARSQSDGPDEARRRKQKKAAPAGPAERSGSYSPPPPPKALPQTPTAAASSSPSAVRKAFDAFALHFEEVNRVRKALYLLFPVSLLCAVYLVLEPTPPPPPTHTPVQGPEPSRTEPAPGAPPVAPSVQDPAPPLVRPDSEVVKVEPAAPGVVAIPDAGVAQKTTGGKASKEKIVSLERRAADAYAAGQLDRAIALYRELLESPEMDAARAPGIAEVLRILEAKKASGKHETLQQAEPPRSVR